MRRVVKFFADAGAQSVQWLTRAELTAVLDEAHRHRMKVTGHLYALTHRDAAELGIDNIEHGFSFMTDFAVKQPDECPVPGGAPDLIKGYADLRGIELLVEGGFTPLEAFKVATSNGARFLGMSDIGSLEAGKRADLVLVKGDPSTRIADVHNIEIVFKDGIGYDPQKLKNSVHGQVGLR